MRKNSAYVATLFIPLIATTAYIYLSIQNVQEHLTTADRIKVNGYPAEEHTVQTSDGYILTVVRIPHSNNDITHRNATNKPIVYLQHGMFCSSDTWIITAPEVTLAYQLVDAGFDVWLGNSRGNRYARQHAHLAVDSQAFWQFSFHEVGAYDMRAIVDYILKNTQQKSLHLISDSQSSAGFFVLLSEQPQYNKVLKTAHHLGPAVIVNNVRSPLRKLATIVTTGQTILGRVFHNREYMAHNPWWIWLCNKTCPTDSLLHPFCNAAMGIFNGDWHLNETLLPALCQTHPAGASTNQLIHYAQLYNVRKFQRFDFGPNLNMLYYNRTTPPEYDLSRVTACSTFYYGDSDLTVEGADVEYLAHLLHCAETIKVPQKNWNHFDMILGDRVKELVNDRIIADIQRYEVLAGKGI